MNLEFGLAALLWWLAASALVAYTARRRGRTVWAWFACALVLSPPMAALSLLAVQPRA